MIAYSAAKFRLALPGRKSGALTLARECLLLLAVMLVTSMTYAKDKPRTAPVPKPATQYVAFETHAAEHVTIAAQPCDDPKACAFFRLPYVEHGFIPVWVIVTNDRDQPLTLDDVRIHFLPAKGERIQAATDEDLNRRLFSRKQAAGTKLPIIPITIHHEPVDEKILNDDNDFGFKSNTVAPHTTTAGYVFYDVRDLDDSVLKGAELYVKLIRSTDADGNKVELFGFSIPFDKWLDAQDKQEARPKQSEPAKPKF